MIEITGYTDLEVIGRGGFAVVYKARQMSVGRDVAIKLLTDQTPDDDLVRRFRRESQAVGALSWHPHIAAVVDAGSTGAGQAYIVFELLSGGSLEEHIEQGPLPWPRAVAAMIQIADATEAAHRSDVLHRDIKPANILMDRLGVAKLGDFGIASMQDGTKTEAGMLATTIAHAAPELFDGAPATAATDVYALGSTLHTLVTGQPPFLAAAGMQVSTTIARIIGEAPPRPDEAQAPTPLATVIAHALAKQPQYRLRSAGEFGKALQQVQRELGQPVTSMPVADSRPPALASESAPAASLPDPPARPSQPAEPLFPDPPAAPDIQDSPHSVAALPAPHPPPPPEVAAAPQKAFRKTIAALTIVAIALAATVGALYFSQNSQRSEVARTAGGASILNFNAFDDTEMTAPFDESAALDQDETTYWGIQAPANGSVRGTAYVINFTEEQQVVRVGISNGEQTELGRVSGLNWGTASAGQSNDMPDFLSQAIPDRPGPFVMDYPVTTDQIVLVLTGAHGDSLNAGIAEILIEVEEGPQ